MKRTHFQSIRVAMLMSTTQYTTNDSIRFTLFSEGRVFVNFDHKHNFTEGEIVRQNVHIQPGGMSRPKDCVARHRVAVVVPYRDRWDHLMILLSHLHPILERQQLDYRIFVVEQVGETNLIADPHVMGMLIFR